MKNLIYLISLIALFSCSNDYEEITVNDEYSEYSCLLDNAIDIAYKTHLWMSEEDMCSEYECCWEYVSQQLRIKYENGETLTIKEKEEIIKGIESSPSYLDTLDETDQFYELYYYNHYNK